MKHVLVDVILEDEGWIALALRDLAERGARQTLVHLGLEPDRFEISLLGTSDARIATLNAEFRQKSGPTNVLSWPSSERAAARDGGAPAVPEQDDNEDLLELGDIALARETCLREAQVAGLSVDHHISHLVVHGVLHLLGYDHERDKDAALMEGLEVEILDRLGIPSPYATSGGSDAATTDR